MRWCRWTVFRAPNAVPADYSPGSTAGGRPGRVNVNLYKPSDRLLLNVEAIAYHEGLPGHHLQFSFADSLKDLPTFRKFASYDAYSEGWALYAELLGKELGFYQDPYSEVRASAERDVAGDPAGGRYGRALQALEPPADGGTSSAHTRRWTTRISRPRSIATSPGPGRRSRIGWGSRRFWSCGSVRGSGWVRAPACSSFMRACCRWGRVPLDVLDASVTRWIDETVAAKALNAAGQPACAAAVTRRRGCRLR